MEIKGKLTRKLKLLSQLGVKLNIFAANDHFVRDVKLWGFNWLKPGMKL